MATRVFGPLGMTRARPHQNNAIAEPIFHAFTSQRGVYEDSTFWDPTWGFNGGMNASVADLGRWLRALDSGALLSPADAEESLAPGHRPASGMTDQRVLRLRLARGRRMDRRQPEPQRLPGLHRPAPDPSVTIVVWSTAAPGNPEESNASQTISQRIADRRERRADRSLPTRLSRSGLGLAGRPSTRSPMVLRTISSVPPPMRMPGVENTYSSTRSAPHSPVSATRRGPSTSVSSVTSSRL